MKKITIKEIAKESNYSIATVSKVLNHKDSDVSDKARKTILSVAKKYNFQLNRAARSLVVNKTKTIGLLLPDISNPFFSDIAKGVEDYAYENGYSIFIGNSYEDFHKEINYLRSMLQLNVDGILIIGIKDYGNRNDDDFIINKPILAIDRKTIYKNILSEVYTDHYIGAKKAMEYLIENNHKNILFVPGPKNSNSAKKRFKAYLDIMKSEGLKFDKGDLHFGDFTIEHGFETINRIENISKYTAIFCCNDLIALGAMAALNKKQIKVPRDISIIGVDDIELSKISSPPLTTMKQPAYKLGASSCRMLIDSINDKTIEKNILLDQSLIIRDSVIKI